MASPRIGAPELVEGQAAPETTVNEIIRFVEQGAGYFIVVSTLTAPPGAPVNAQAHIVGTTPTGAWSGFTAGRIAFYSSGVWFQIPVYEGTLCYHQTDNKFYRNTGGGGVAAWEDGPGYAPALAADIWTGTSQVKYITPDALFDAAAPVALTSSASITPNLGVGLNFSLTLAHNATLENPSNAKTGQSGVIAITQDGTGSRTLDYGTNWKFPGGAPVLSTAAGSIDALTYYVSASGVILCNLTKAYSS